MAAARSDASCRRPSGCATRRSGPTISARFHGLIEDEYVRRYLLDGGVMTETGARRASARARRCSRGAGSASGWRASANRTSWSASPASSSSRRPNASTADVRAVRTLRGATPPRWRAPPSPTPARAVFRTSSPRPTRSTARRCALEEGGLRASPRCRARSATCSGCAWPGAPPTTSWGAKLRALGVESGGVLLVHTAFSKVAPVDGGPEGLIDALRAALGPDGTLVMPSMCDDDDHPFDATTLLPRAGHRRRHLLAPARRPPQRQPPRLRRAGPRAAPHHRAPPRRRPPRPRQPRRPRRALDGQVLLLGVGHDANTTIHLAE